MCNRIQEFTTYSVSTPPLWLFKQVSCEFHRVPLVLVVHDLVKTCFAFTRFTSFLIPASLRRTPPVSLSFSKLKPRPQQRVAAVLPSLLCFQDQLKREETRAAQISQAVGTVRFYAATERGLCCVLISLDSGLLLCSCFQKTVSAKKPLATGSQCVLLRFQKSGWTNWGFETSIFPLPFVLVRITDVFMPLLAVMWFK